ncbi:MAG: cadherin domain-containing protein [Neisseriaceae bacterium]|nr:cadherin domain-containing protein [Neisseriaceae bacterium]
MYRLNIIRDGYVVETRQIEAGKTLKLSAQPNTSYQLLDETGMVLHESPQAYILGSDWVLMDNAEPILVLENYTQYFPISDTNVLMANNMTLMTTVPTNGVPLEPVLASEVSSGASATGVPLGAKIAAGLLAAGSVVALAGGSGGSSSDDKPVVDPNNPDNHLPSLKLGKSEVSVKENIQGATITTVQATDEDGDKISYSVSDSRFEIDDKGNLKLKAGQSLDYETDKPINLKITAKDGKGASVSKTLKVNVENVNEQPDLSVGKNEVSIKENIQGATITTVSFKDPDGDKAQYEISDNRFEIVSGSLKLKAGQFLDYEKEKTVTVKITAKDGKGFQDVETVKINVQDVNEQPDLTVGKNEVSIKENIQGATITTVSFKDPDGDKPQYEVSDNRFEVVSGNLKLKAGQFLDYETDKPINLKITAKDGKGLQDTETVKINVQDDASDNPVIPPALNNNAIKLSLEKDTGASNSDKITNNGTIKVAGVDGQKWVYSNDGGKTWKAGSGNQISITGDGEKNVQVSLSEDGKNPIANPQSIKFTLDTSIKEPSIDYDYNNGTLKITIIAEPNSTLQTKFDGVDEKIVVDATGKYEIKLDIPQDDSEVLLPIQMTAVDQAGNKSKTVEKTVIIPALDVDPVTPPANQAPVWSKTSETITVKENWTGNIPSQATASDPDKDTLTYSVSGDSRFSIDSKTGSLKLNSALDFENEKDKSISLKVTASDGKGGKAEKTVHINLTNDPNDDPVTPPANQPPVWSQTSETVSIKENAKGATVSTDKASDSDGDALTYSIDEASQKLFTIDSKTGTLKVKDVLDYETAKQHQVKVTASDGKLSAVKTVTVNVENVNESPVWSQTSETITVKENWTGEIPTKETATDPDKDTLTYSVSGDSRFSIDSKTGSLKLNSALDFENEKDKSVSLKVTASDGKGGKAEKTVHIDLTNDPNDDPVTPPANQAPVWSQTFEMVDIEENWTGEIPTKETATDPDNDTLTYRVSDSRFSIDSTGTLKLNSALNFKKDGIFHLEVTASDGKGGEAVKYISVSVINPNKPPVIKLESHEETVVEKMPGIEIAKFTVTDDRDDKVSLEYNLWARDWEGFVDLNLTDLFDLEALKEGVIKLKNDRSFDYDVLKRDGAGERKIRLSLTVKDTEGLKTELEELDVSIKADHPVTGDLSLSLKNDTGFDNSDRVTNDATVRVDGLKEGYEWKYKVLVGFNSKKVPQWSDWITGTGDTIAHEDIRKLFVPDDNYSEYDDPKNNPLLNGGESMSVQVTYADTEKFELPNGQGWDYSETKGLHFWFDNYFSGRVQVYNDVDKDQIRISVPGIGTDGDPKEKSRKAIIKATFVDQDDGSIAYETNPVRVDTLYGDIEEEGDFKQTEDSSYPASSYEYVFNYGELELSAGKYEVKWDVRDLAGNSAYTTDGMIIRIKDKNSSSSLMNKSSNSADDDIVVLSEPETQLRLTDILDDGHALLQKSSDQVLMVNGYQYDTQSDIAHVNMFQDTAYLL